MDKQRKGTNSKKKIADEILYQIGGSVIFVLLLIAAVAICMVGWLSITSKNRADTGVQCGCKPTNRFFGTVYKKRGTTGR